jgi:RNA polymerase sigma-70 factor, ECF subfamily
MAPDKEPTHVLAPGPRAVKAAGTQPASAVVERMFVTHHAMIWRLARRHGLSPTQAANVTEETFRVAALHLTDIRVEDERTFLVGTALELAQERSLEARRGRLQSDTQVRCLTNTGVGELQILDLALAGLDQDLLEVFVLFEIEGLSLSDIAAAVELPLDEVSLRLQGAREGLRCAMSDAYIKKRPEGHADTTGTAVDDISEN